MKEGTKYQPLLEFLRDNNQDEVKLTFAEIEALIDSNLPDSARSQRAWWSNRRKGALQAEAWMEVGYRVEDVDFEQQQVTFRKPVIIADCSRMRYTFDSSVRAPLRVPAHCCRSQGAVPHKECKTL